MLLAEAKRQTDFWQERGDGEPNEEGGKETHPREMEGAHVGSLKGHELDFSGLVILIGINIDVVGLIFLYFGLWSSIKKRHYNEQLEHEKAMELHVENKLCLPRLSEDSS